VGLKRSEARGPVVCRGADRAVHGASGWPGEGAWEVHGVVGRDGPEAV